MGFFFETYIKLSCWEKVGEGEDLGSGQHPRIDRIREGKKTVN